ncbi:hypothetical protein [Spirosoma utsteinense]|uniref:Uncharacterized protein n=1 Tax=Spirosoma utsteinense TaxID=2585773 RepID=A0ABR6WA83_9BACT|nr:hypothetical protein [Spirosoma utsteinense]MBC3784121.1 hypothetical protein [Spirosoma utsteinense]MBC3792790.1 hypothetical protein [Spirosoma utsteinense]
METLNPQQVARLHDHLIRTCPNAALIDELLDHLACEVEHYMWIGLPFESAMDKALLEVNAGVVRELRQTYQRELGLRGSRLEKASKDDIVFEFRNKAYGAYALRQAYPQNLRNATIMTLSLCMLLMAVMHMVGHGTFSYFSSWGAVWLTGLAGITFVGFNWHLHQEGTQTLNLH